MLLKQKTNKLFYNKWPYKVTCKIEGAHLIRLHKFKLLSYTNYNLRIKVDLENLKIFLTLSRKFIENENVKTRIQYNNIDFYVLTKAELDDLLDVLRAYIIGITEPDNNTALKVLLENNKYNFCDNFPHGKYKFKITFKEMAQKTRSDLIAWAEKYNNDDIYVPKSTKNHFKCIKYHYGSHYFYVKDSKMITLISLAAGGNIRRIEEFVLRSSINTA